MRDALITWLAGACAASVLAGERLWVADFESGDLPGRGREIEVVGEGVEVALEERAGEGGRALRLRSREPLGSCGIELRRRVSVEKNLVLSFDHREEIEPGEEGAYLGMSFFVGGEQWFWASDEFSGEWRRVEIPFGSLKSSSGKSVSAGLGIDRIRLYARVKERDAARKGATRARMTVWFDNVRVRVAPVEGSLTDRVRVSDANPPFFNWARPAAGAGRARLQYSTDARFPRELSVSVEVADNFHTPPAPLAEGTYYWRVWTAGDLVEGWSEIERVVVPPGAHRFVTGAVTEAKLASLPRPRLLPGARVAEPEVGEARRAQLLKRARDLYRRGVPEHPGPHVEGDPRWPTWIEWYGKVAGKITGGTGRALEDLGRCAIVTGDADAIGWARELGLRACDWDPDGGSAMARGDIGAHHLLRGMSWCYDAARDRMTAAERERYREVLARRAEQFHARLNPYRSGEANNHAWLQAFGLAEAGVVLAGDHPGATGWVEVVRQLYVGRYLACLGEQGDNNEGIGYWAYGLGFVVDYADMMRAVCGIDLYRHPWLRQTARFPMYCAPPGAWAISFADTGMPNHGVRGPAATRLVRDLAVRVRDPYALWYSGERGPVDGLEPRAPSDLVPSIHYRKIGWGIFNTSLVDGAEGVTVAMRSGRYQAGHQHPDQNAFVIHAYGEKLAIDGGYYDWYGSPHFKAYSMHTLAHNTLLVDGVGQAACREGADGRIVAWHDSPAFGYVAGDASDPEIYGGALSRFERRLLFVKPGVVVVWDIVRPAREGARCEWLLHAVVPIRAGAGAFEIPCAGASLRGRWLAPEGVEQTVDTGFPVEPVNRYSRDPVPPEDYFPEWILRARDRAGVAGEREYLVAMQVRRRGARGEPEAEIEGFDAENARGIRVTIGGRAWRILVRAPGATGEMRGGGVESDGEIAAVELDAGGAPVRAFGAGATRVACGGARLAGRSGPGFVEAPGR